MGLTRASLSAKQTIGRYAVCDVIELTCCGRRLNTVLLEISLTSFKKWTPTSGSLNRNDINNLLATPSANSVARPDDVDGTYVFSWWHRWYVSKTDFTRVSVNVIIFHFLLERQNFMESENKTALRSRMYAILSSGANMTKLDAPSGGEDFIVLCICCRKRWNSSCTCGWPSLISTSDRSSTHGTGAELSFITNREST
jgi:hypothetical protein